MENGFYFYKRQLNQTEIYNQELIRILGEIDKKLRHTKRVYFEILEERKKYLICMDDCMMIVEIVIMSDTPIFEVNIPKTFIWGEESEYRSLDEIYSEQTKTNIAEDKKYIRVLLNGTIEQSKKLLECGVKSTVFK